MLFQLNKISSFLFISCLLFSCNKNTGDSNVHSTATLTPYTLTYPSYFPQLNIPKNNPLTEEGISLGRQLYYDPILSNNGYSCSSCHSQAEAFSSYSANSLPHMNLAWNSFFLWNGKISGDMEDIMMFEVNDFFQTDIHKLNESTYYNTKFKDVFGVNTITSKEVAYALAQFFRSMVSVNSKFDQYIQHKIMLSPQEINGMNIFFSEKGDCFHCHSLGLFTDTKFHNIGLDSTFTGVNRGRYEISLDSFDMGLFKTPTLRNIEMTAPYMHDGRFQTLEEVIEHYNSQVKFSSTVDPIMTKASKKFGLLLTPNDKSNLVTFLKTLTDTSFLNNPKLAHP